VVVTTQSRIKEHWAPCGRRESTQDYYVVRQGRSDYAGYWGIKTDPDGVVRNRDSEDERARFVSDSQEIIQFVNGLKPISVLDFGSGPGWLLNELVVPCKAAVEVSPEAIEKLRKSDVIVYDDIVQASPSSFDVIIANHVIEHLIDPLYVVNHFHRILHPGGHLILGTPDFGSPCAKRFGANYRMLHDPTHISLFTLESCSRMLRDCGFTIDNLTFPFPQRYAMQGNWARWHDTSRVSPPWPGNFLTYFARRT